MASKKNQQTPTGFVDPAKFEWAEKEGSYLLRLALPGLRKDDLRVLVDRAGRLTVRGTRPANTSAAGLGSFSKVFQLPSAASLDDIAGRFEAGVLTLTVPKRAGHAEAPTSIEEIKRKLPGVATEDNKVAKEEVGKGDMLKSNAMNAAAMKAQQRKQRQEGEIEAMSRQDDEQKLAPVPVKPKAPHALWLKPKTDIGSDKGKLAAHRESLAERVRRHGVQERAKAAAAATAGTKAIVEGEPKVLTDMKWADGLVEAARNNKEVVAVGIAAFSLGILVSQKLFRK